MNELRSIWLNIFFVFASCVFSQPEGLPDSVKWVYSNCTSDTEKLNILQRFVETEQNSYRWNKVNNFALSVINNLSIHPDKELVPFLKRAKANALSNLAYFNDLNGKREEAIRVYHEALKIFSELNQHDNVAIMYNNIGYSNEGLGRVEEALDYYMKALEIKEKLGLKSSLAYSYINLGTFFDNQGDAANAETYYFKSIKASLESGNKDALANAYNNLGVLAQSKGNIPKALNYFNKTLILYNEIKNDEGIAGALDNIAVQENNTGNHQKAFELMKQSLEIRLRLNDRAGEGNSYNSFCNLYTRMKNYSLASKMGEKAKSIANEIHSPKLKKEACLCLKNVYELKGDLKRALENTNLYYVMRDSIYNEHIQKNSYKQQMKYEYEKEKLLMQKEQEKQNIINNKEKQVQQKIIYGAVVVLIIISAFSISLYSRYRITNRQKKIIENQRNEMEEQKKIVENKNKEIIDSIRYAKRIQSALITSEKYIGRALNNTKK
jgi:tetratricopeptide (TPR) repeat protein